MMFFNFTFGAIKHICIMLYDDVLHDCASRADPDADAGDVTDDAFPKRAVMEAASISSLAIKTTEECISS